MKKKNQTISLRDLVKKMKRHSTRTIVLTATVMAILCGGLIYAFFPIQDVEAQEKETLNMQQPQSEMQKQLRDILNYLQELDGKTKKNEKTLAQLQKDAEIDRQREKGMTLEKEGTVIKSISEMKKSMDTLHDQIIQTEQQISGLQEQMNQGTVQNQQNVDQNFTKITESLEQISQNYIQAQSQIEELLKNMSDEDKEHYQNLVDKLAEIQTDMKNADVKNLMDMTQRLKEMETVYLKELKNLQIHMDDRITDMNADMSEQLNTMNTAVIAQYQSFQQQFGSDNQELLRLLSDTRKDVTEKFDQVFRRVSDGKNLLASALLTKGVDIKADATFAEYAEAIRNIPQQLLIGVDKLPGTIYYDYHHHICGDGSEPGTEQEDEAGGCYTVPVYHVHKGSPLEAGGCYTIPVYHSHSQSCYTTYSYSVVTDTIIGEAGEENGHARHIYHCDGCNGTFSGTNGWHIHNERALICGKNTNQIDRYTVSCNMTPQTIVGYRPGCGLSEGQITAAHIIYENTQNQNIGQMKIAVPAMDYPESGILSESKTILTNDLLPVGVSFAGNAQEEPGTEIRQEESESVQEKTVPDESVESNVGLSEADVQASQTEMAGTAGTQAPVVQEVENDSSISSSLEKFQQ